MPIEGAFPHVVFEVYGIGVRDTVVVTWAIMLALSTLAFAGARTLRARPGGVQNALEAIVEGMEGLVRDITTYDAGLFLPLIGALGLFLAVSSSVSVLPGVGAPTRDLSTAAALAAIVFVSVHYYGIRLIGARRYLKTYLEPSPILLPFNVIGEVTRTAALALRLFGNALSGELVVAVVVLLAGLLVPVPLQIFGVLIGMIQAYVFTLLAMVYIAAGLRPNETPDEPRAEAAGGEEESAP